VPTCANGVLLSHETNCMLVGMQADTGRKYRAYPTTEQAERLMSWGHTCRWLYNVALAQREHRSARSATHRVTLNDQCAELTRARREFDWLRDLPAQSGQQVLRHLRQAYLNWWNPQHPAGPPAYRKRDSRLSVPFPGQAVTVRRLSRRWAAVTLPKLGDVRFRWSRTLGGTVRNATIGFDGANWHVGFGVATGRKPPTQHARPASTVGVDRGVKVALALSDGRMWNRPFRTPGQHREMARLKSKAGRQETARGKTRTKTSNRARKVRAAIARAEARVRARRQDFAHWTANRICARYAIVALEDLRTASMTATASGTVDAPGTNVAQKAGLNRAILDKGWHTFEVALANQARITGTQIVKVSAAYTSQRCSRCKVIHPDSRESQAVFRCVACGFTANADVNAAINIRDAAEAALQLTGRAVRDTGREAPCRPPTRRRRRKPATSEAGISSLQGREDAKRAPRRYTRS
jgi:putative transposase